MALRQKRQGSGLRKSPGAHLSRSRRWGLRRGDRAAGEIEPPLAAGRSQCIDLSSSVTYRSVRDGYIDLMMKGTQNGTRTHRTTVALDMNAVGQAQEVLGTATIRDRPGLARGCQAAGASTGSGARPQRNAESCDAGGSRRAPPRAGARLTPCLGTLPTRRSGAGRRAGRRPDISERLAERLERDEVATTEPVILEALHRARNGVEYEHLYSSLFEPLQRLSVSREASIRAVAVQRALASTRHGSHLRSHGHFSHRGRRGRRRRRCALVLRPRSHRHLQAHRAGIRSRGLCRAGSLSACRISTRGGAALVNGFWRNCHASVTDT